MDQLDDQQIISAVLDGNTNAYSILVERYQRQIYSLMYRMAGSDADAADYAQETFIRAYEQLHRFKEGGAVFPLALHDRGESLQEPPETKKNPPDGLDRGLRTGLGPRLPGTRGRQPLREDRLPEALQRAEGAP